jgi:hypothetical protein
VQQQVLKYRLSQQVHPATGRAINRAVWATLIVGMSGAAAFVTGLVLTAYYSNELEGYSPEISKFAYAFLLISFIFQPGHIVQARRRQRSGGERSAGAGY